MRSTWKYLIVAFSIFTSQMFALSPTMVGKRAPDFNLRSLDGSTSHALSNYRGEVVILDFWASWCGPCKISLPKLAQLESSYKGVRLLAINVDDDKSNAITFLRRLNVRVTALFDQDKQVAAMFDVPEMPSAIVLDKKGIIRFLHVGYSDGDVDQIKKHIEELL